MALGAHLPDRHGRQRGPGRAAVAAAGQAVAGGADRLRRSRAAHDHAAGGRGHRPAGDPRQAGAARSDPGRLGNTHRLLHRSRRRRPGLRLHALPGGHPGGRAAQPRHPRRDHCPHPGGGPVADPGAHHPAAGGARAGARHRPGPGTQPGRVRGDHRLRRLQGGRHPHHAAGHLPGAGERHGDLPGAGRGAHRPVIPHYRNHERALDRPGGRPPPDPEPRRGGRGGGRARDAEEARPLPRRRRSRSRPG